ncbi:MAG: hypothetical protein ACRKFN_16805, partial [Desulfitobacterium sp.]
PFMHKIGSNNKPKIIGQFKIAESLAHQVIQRFFVFYLLKSGGEVCLGRVAYGLRLYEDKFKRGIRKDTSLR